MSVRPFEPKFMKMSILTAALQELTPRQVRGEDSDRAIEDWLQFARELDCPNIQISAALHPTEADGPPGCAERTVVSRPEKVVRIAHAQPIVASLQHTLPVRQWSMHQLPGQRVSVHIQFDIDPKRTVPSSDGTKPNPALTLHAWHR
jgi:hypothetical protein